MAGKAPHEPPLSSEKSSSATEGREAALQVRASLRARLQEAEEILRAIREGEVDALAIHGNRGPSVRMLSGAEHPYSVLVEAMSEGALTLTPEGRILFSNAAFVRLAGAALEQLLQHDIQRYVEPADLPLLAALLKRGVKENSQGELRLLIGEQQIPVLLSLSALDLDGLPCVCMIVTDLREQKRKQQVLASERLTNSILDQATEAIIVCDLQGTITRANQRAQSLCGYNPQLAVFDEAFPLYTPPPDLSSTTPITGARVSIADVLHGAAYSGREVVLQRGSDHPPLSMLLSAGPVRSPENQIIGCVVNLMDITARKQAEQAQAELLRREQRAHAQAQAANQAKDVFLATLSHELRTPLSAVLGWVRLLRDGQTPQLIEKAVNVIERNARIQAQLIDDILDISRIVSGKISLQTRIVNLCAVAAAAFESVRMAAESKGITLRSLLPDEPLLVSGDTGRLQQVIWNLLSNATKFTPKGGTIEVRLAAVDQSVAVTVADNGQGISADFLPYVFDRFRQADGSTTRIHGGLGLGLAIARYIVEAHGGTVEVTSPGANQGSTFVVRLPRAQATGGGGKATEVGATPPGGSPIAGGAAQQTLLLGLRVLLVDDQPDMLSFLAMELQRHGAQVATAGSVAMARRLLAERPPDVLISDIAMPGSDGYHLVHELREREAAARVEHSIPAIALSALARTTDAEAALHAGFQRHLAKPVDIAELVHAVAELGAPRRQA
jgi:PAS domain S-box-containing protein